MPKFGEPPKIVKAYNKLEHVLQHAHNFVCELHPLISGHLVYLLSDDYTRVATIHSLILQTADRTAALSSCS